MGIRRRGDESLSKSLINDSMNITPENSGVRGVQSVNPLDNDTSDNIKPATKGSGPEAM